MDVFQKWALCLHFPRLLAVEGKGVDILGQVMIGKWIRMRSLPIVFLLRQFTFLLPFSSLSFLRWAGHGVGGAKEDSKCLVVEDREVRSGFRGSEFFAYCSLRHQRLFTHFTSRVHMMYVSASLRDKV